MRAATTSRPSGPATPAQLSAFEAARPRLLGLAYRMLGSLVDAEDVVQEVWLKFWRAEGVQRPEAWLTTVTTRAALDRLRSLARRRESYIGPWLPEPVADESPDEAVELASSLTLGFLTLLDELNPTQRAVFLLADVFAVPFGEIAAAVGKSEAACRQIASRARRHLAAAPVSSRRPTGAEQQVVDELLRAIATGDVDAALARLSPDVVLVSDGGPRRRAARRPVVTSTRVLRLMVNIAKRYAAAQATMWRADINGEPGLVVAVDGSPDTVLVFDVEDQLVTRIWVVRNPDKLGHVTRPVTLR
jgi:RNA polymerase sigma-70 factor (ECF subfamily)